jgi:hypothetical protein
MSKALDKLSLDLRSAILGGEHIRAGELARQYTSALRELWEAMPASERAVSPFPRQARELIAWAHGMTVIQRALAADQLTVVRKARRYHAARSTQAPRPIVQLRG